MRISASHSNRPLWAAAAAVGLLLTCAPTARAGANTSGAVTIDLSGRVRARCGFQTPPPSSVDVDLSVAGSVSEAFVLDCNTPFRLRVASEHGTLALNDADGAPAQLGRSDPYQVEVKFKTDLGAFDETCDAADLKGRHGGGGCAFYGDRCGEGLSSGDGVAIGQSGALNVSWTAPATTLVAGRYADTLTIVVEARI
ncbi:MAG TPA: hypothetical protein VGG29_05385 [Caulobacteraceae bacterium]|jgi:hypothetical protein